MSKLFNKKEESKINYNETQYKELLERILYHGIATEDRTGVGTKVLTNQVLNLRANEIPLITGKKIFWKTAVAELNLFLNGKTTLEEFHEAGVKYWDQFANEKGELGPIYGAQWVNWGPEGIDQIKQVIESVRYNPHSRRHIVTAWNPSDTDKMSLPPCPVLFQLNVVDGKLDMLVFQRSADMFLGVPFDIFQYYLLMEYIRLHAGLRADKDDKSGIKLLPGKLTFMFGNAHIYNNHKSQVAQYLTNPIHNAPHGWWNPVDNDKGERNLSVDITDYKHGEYIKAEIN